MGKYRSKLKRHTKGKSWGKGHSSTSNPEQMKHRLKAKSRFFQPNLNMVSTDSQKNGLTLEAVLQHEQRQAYDAEKTTVNDVAGSLKSINLNDEDENMSYKTFKTFASDYSSCSNMSFKKLLSGFRVSSELHKEMLAILTALTEIIKNRGGTESSTEYFLLLMEQVEGSVEDIELTAGVSLLAMGIKTVPAAVLCKRFEETAQILLTLLQRFVDSSNQSILRYIIECLSVLLRAQDYTTWTYSSTWQYIEAILSFTIHSKPKIRKAAQHAIISIIHGSRFMLSLKVTTGEDAASTTRTLEVTSHPASNRVTKFCLNQFQPKMLTNSQTIVLYTLTLLKDIISGFKTEDIRSICEHLLSIMTAANVLVRTNCLQVLHALFESRTMNLDSSLCGQLVAVIHEYRPNRSDVRQTLAWLTVLKEGHIHLAALDLPLCINALPHLINVCRDIWLSDRVEIITGVSNCVKDIFLECVRPACATKQLANTYSTPISRIISIMNKILNAAFEDVGRCVILSFSIVFEVCGEYFRNELGTTVQSLAKRYDTQSSLLIQIEHAIIAAISSMGPESVLKNIPLTNAKGEVLLERSWLLPLLREGVSVATFIFFKDTILPLALNCNTKWHDYESSKQVSLSHTYELLCCQLWGLFPGFCRNPIDPENFRLIAPTIGNALDNNPEFRGPIFDGFIELIKNDNNTKIHDVLGKYSKNFLPRLFNIYTQKPDGTYATDLRNKSLEVIKLYLTKTPEYVLKELFNNARDQLSGTTVGTFEYDALFDITAALVLYQSCDIIRKHYETFIVPILKNEKSQLVSKDEQKLKKQQQKVYEFLLNIFVSEAASCRKFNRQNVVAVQQMLLETFTTSCAICQASRLKCLKFIMENQKSITHDDKIVMKTIPEAVISYKEFSTSKENVSEEIIKFIANLYQKADKLNDFIDILTAGFAGDESLITNTILAYRTVLQNYGKHITIATLEFLFQQVSVFLVQKPRIQAEASVAFLISFIKVLPAPFTAKHLESIMRSLSAMTKDTKRYCRIQIGYLLKKLCKRFTVEELTKYVPGDDEVTHRRLKKIRKTMRRETRQKLNEEKSKDSTNEDTDDEYMSGLQKKSVTIDDILADSDSDLDDDMNEVIDETGKTLKKKSIAQNTYIREDPEDIVDLADIKSIGNVLTNRPDVSVKNVGEKSKEKDINRGFRTAEDGRLIISDKALSNLKSYDESEDSDSISKDISKNVKKATKRGMEEDSSEEEAIPPSRKRKSTDALSMRSNKTKSVYTTGGKGIHRSLGSHDALSMNPSGLTRADTEYLTKKAHGYIKTKNKLDPYAYIPLDRSKLNKRKRAKMAGTFNNIVKGARKGALKGIKARISKTNNESTVHL